MRAVYLGENGAKKERTGTGVFSPRRCETIAPEPRKKPGCSRALAAERVVHALNLNLDSVDTPAHAHFRGISNITPQYDATLKLVSRIGMAQRRDFVFLEIPWFVKITDEYAG